MQEIEINTFQRPMPEINRLKFPKIGLDFTILQGVANKLFRNESYITRKYTILAFSKLLLIFSLKCRARI